MAGISDQFSSWQRGRRHTRRPTSKAITEKIPANYAQLPEEQRKQIALRLARQIRAGLGYQDG